MSRVIVLTVLALLVPTATAGAAFTSSASGGNGVMTGSADVESLAISSAGGLLRHDRVGGGFNSAFDFDTATGGDQTLSATGGSLVVNAGDGNDVIRNDNTGGSAFTLQGQGGDDDLEGSGTADIISGGPGDDVLTGDGGGDTLNGDDGDDRFVWLNGDGSDLADGGTGTDTSAIVGAVASEEFTVRPTRTERTAPSAFNVTMTAVEVSLVEGAGGDDRLTVDEGVPAAVRFDGGSGGDTFTGSSGDETFHGGSGADVATGGGGRDLLDGGLDNDSFFARDGVTDLIRCGEGSDSAQTDAVTVDASSGCEIVDASPAPPPVTVPGPTVLVPVAALSDTTAPTARLAATSSKLARNRRSFPVRIACGAGEPCRVTFDVLLASAVTVRGVKVRAVVKTVTATVGAGRTANVNVRVPASITRLFRGRRSLGLRLVGSVRDAAGNTRALTGRVTLRR